MQTYRQIPREADVLEVRNSTATNAVRCTVPDLPTGAYRIRPEQLLGFGFDRENVRTRYQMNYNWCPKNFAEFCNEAANGRVRLNIQPAQYAWLYDNVMPWRPWLYLLGFGSYMERLFRRMLIDENTFWKVHNYGIDLMLS